MLTRDQTFELAVKIAAPKLLEIDANMVSAAGDGVTKAIHFWYRAIVKADAALGDGRV